MGLLYLYLNTLNAQLTPICHLLALLGAHHILHVSRVRAKHSLRKTGLNLYCPPPPICPHAFHSPNLRFQRNVTLERHQYHLYLNLQFIVNKLRYQSS
jgi:hypothetical protein